jgi:translation elongation factor EF-1beta
LLSYIESSWGLVEEAVTLEAEEPEGVEEVEAAEEDVEGVEDVEEAEVSPAMDRQGALTVTV